MSISLFLHLTGGLCVDQGLASPNQGEKMARRSRGSRSKTRKLLRADAGTRTPITARIQKFNVGDKAVVKINPSFHEGMPHPRFFGTVGTIVEKRGSSYVVEIKDKEKTKKLIAAPVHLRALRGDAKHLRDIVIKK